MPFQCSRLAVIRRGTLLAVLPMVLVRCASEESAGDSRVTDEVSGGAPASAGAAAEPGIAGERSQNQGGSGGEVGMTDPNTDAGASGEAAGGRTSGGPSGAGGEPGDAESALVRVPNAEFKSGDPPATQDSENLPAIVGLMGPSATTNGGTTTLRIELDGEPETPTFIVVLDGDSGYFIATATDTNGDGIYEIEIQIGANVDLSTLTVRVAPVDAQGNVGVYQSLQYEVVQSGVGDVKVTLSFDRDADLDLHVVEPEGFEIFFGEPLSPTGGELDLDSNASCRIDGQNAENVFWPQGAAPRGTYEVYVTYFDPCEVSEAVRYTVSVYNGPGVETFRGTFEVGMASEKRLLTRFVH